MKRPLRVDPSSIQLRHGVNALSRICIREMLARLQHTGELLLGQMPRLVRIVILEKLPQALELGALTSLVGNEPDAVVPVARMHILLQVPIVLAVAAASEFASQAHAHRCALLNLWMAHLLPVLRIVIVALFSKLAEGPAVNGGGSAHVRLRRRLWRLWNSVRGAAFATVEAAANTAPSDITDVDLAATVAAMVLRKTEETTSHLLGGQDVASRAHGDHRHVGVWPGCSGG
mmetsp:Transcript_147279/g.473106  ORF Transcript_147279/g.473106 Transcript_147279/m.473106 type:complete len:231 (+) Transcript_147279:1149-1841(+)